MFNNHTGTDPLQHEIASRGGHASRKAAEWHKEGGRAYKRAPLSSEERTHDPATAPPGFERSASA